MAEIDGCFDDKISFALESTLSGHAQANILRRAREIGYQIEIHYLWIPSTTLAIKRIAQRVKKGGHHIPSEDVKRRYGRSLENFVHTYAPLADVWMVWDNSHEPARLLLRSHDTTFDQLAAQLLP